MTSSLKSPLVSVTRNYSSSLQTKVTNFPPASGSRLSGSGYLNLVGTNGFAWSSAPDSASSGQGSYLYFDKSGVDPESHYNRARGFPVRCARLSWVLWGDSTSAR